MTTVVAVQMSENAAKLIELGKAFRRGGVVYRSDGGILEHLKDTPYEPDELVKQERVVEFLQDGMQHPNHWLTTTGVPLAANGIGFAMVLKRLGEVQAQLLFMQDELKKVSDKLSLLDVKMDADLIGQAIGSFRALCLELGEGPITAERMKHFREVFLQAAEKARLVVEGILRESAALRVGGLALRRYFDVYGLFQIAARDICLRIDQPSSARALTEESARWLEGMVAEMTTLSRRPTLIASFAREHRHARASASEAAARFRGHLLMLEAQQKPSELLSA